MSILQEYERIRSEIGEEQYKGLEIYLKFHPELLLSDLLYHQENWDTSQKWLSVTPEIIKNQEPVYLVTENYKGICEHNFFGTKEEIMDVLDLEEGKFDRLFLRYEKKEVGADVIEMMDIHDSNPTYHSRPDVSYSIQVGRSENDLLQFLKGERNDLSRMKEDSDWYYDFDLERSGTEGKRILMHIAAETKYLDLYSIIVKQMEILDIRRTRTDLTNGVIGVSVLGVNVVMLPDTILQKQMDGNFHNGIIAMGKDYEHCGEVIDGWGSVIPDEKVIDIAVKYHQEKIQAALNRFGKARKPELNTLITEGKKEVAQTTKSKIERENLEPERN